MTTLAPVVTSARGTQVRELVTQAEYARRRGCSKMAVTKAVQREQIRLVQGLIDPIEADASWPRRDARESVQTSPSRPPAAPPASAPTGGESRGNGAAPRRPRGSSARPDDMSAHDAKGDLDWYKAQIAAVELAKLQGELLDAADVEKDVFEAYRIVREHLLALPDRECEALAREVSAGGCRAILERAIRHALTELHAELRPADS